MTRTFVTGATGFIGGHLVPRLLARGPVTALVKGRAWLPSGVRGMPGDVTKPKSLRLGGSEVVYHMAAVSFVPQAVRDPRTTFRVNVDGTLNMLDAARRADSLKRFVFLSSAQVYGPAGAAKIDEDHALAPRNPYGASKAAADRLVHAYHETYGLPTVVLRLFNVYGPGQDRSFLVPTIVHQLRKGRSPKLGDGRPVRDFTYIADVVDLLVRVARHPKAVGETFNVGTGKGTPVSDVAKRLMRIAGVAGRPRFKSAPGRAGEAERLVADSTRVRARTGWRPRVGLTEGLGKTWLG